MKTTEGEVMSRVEMRADLPSDELCSLASRLSTFLDLIISEKGWATYTRIVEALLSRAAKEDTDTLFWCVSAFRDCLLAWPDQLVRHWLQAHQELIDRDDLENRCLLEDRERDRETIALLLEARSFGQSRDDEGRTRPLEPQARALDVVLVVPPRASGSSFLQPPLDFLLASTRLRALGANVRVFDLRVMAVDELLCDLARSTPALVVVTTTPYDQVQNYYVDYRLRLSIHLINALASSLAKSQTCLVVAGSHGTVRPDLILRDSQADAVIRGEYDILLPQLYCDIRDGVRTSASWIAWAGSDPQSHEIDLYHPPATFLECPVGDEVLPDYESLEIDRYYGDIYKGNMPFERPRWATLIAARGCPFRCTFCYNAWGHQVRRRSPQSVLDEFALLQSIGAEHVFVLDFTFTVNRQWVHEVCSEYRRRNLRISWTCETRADLVDAEILQDMAGAGCNGIWFGVESFDSHIVRTSRKYTSAEASMQAIREASRCGIAPHAFIMIGLPGESTNSIRSTFSTIKELRVPYTKSVIVATPRYGTEYFRLAQMQFPELRLEDSFYRLNYIKGVVANDLSSSQIRSLVATMRQRENLLSTEG